jgi:two-component system cell cycle sensor histidine kinase/response regulator CckA
MTDATVLEEQLHEAQRLASIGLFAGGIAHDFNNILTVILSSAALLRGRLSDRPDAQEELREIEVAAGWGAALTKHLLTFARRQARQPQLVDLTDLTARTERLLRRLIGEHIELTTVLPPLPGLIWADPAQVEQVLVNLGLNARDAMPRGGRLRIETAAVHLGYEYAATHPELAPGQYVAVTISDTGHGMTPDIMARMSEPLFTTKAEGQGTGLGLTTSYEMVRRNGGHIAVTSEPGKGTTFRLYFPLIEHAAVPTAPPTSAVWPGGTETILVAEDDAAVRSVAARTLQSLGYRVLEAGHGAEALELAAAHAGCIHLLVTDVVMPHVNGKVLADKLRGARPELKVLFTSGYPAEAFGKADIQVGEDFIGKPYDPASLARRVRRLLGVTRSGLPSSARGRT